MSYSAPPSSHTLIRVRPRSKHSDPAWRAYTLMLNRRLIQKRLSFLSAWTTANTFQILLRNSLNNGWEDL